MNELNHYLSFTPEVIKALENKQPVVALESTIITHGMPYPLNLSTAKEVEDIIRHNGAVPATIGIIKGKIKIGMTHSELEFFASAADAIKVSRRDLPFVIANKLNGATTVAGTMICAALAGIPVFVTGGIGGVHRGAAETWDISADLNELMQTNVAVICAGVKSILDIGKTLEYLETSGVPVFGYRTDDFPAFYTRKSGLKVNYKIENAGQAAEIIITKLQLKLGGGVVIANPVPETEAMDENIINQAINSALEEAEKLRIKGKEITPFLLDKVNSITSGQSLKSNIALVKNNARLGAEIAVAYNKLLAEMV